MNKQFELSTYGVEEMNEEEIFDINGGALVTVLAIVSISVAVAGLVWAVYAHYDGEKFISTHKLPEPYIVLDADSIVVTPNGAKIIYNPTVTVIPYRPE